VCQLSPESVVTLREREREREYIGEGKGCKFRSTKRV
jgi:hypothetical protein